MKSNRGITLIEMIVVVSIIGILFAIVYPQYLDRSLRAKRVDAKSALLALAAEQEKFFLTNNRFATTLAELGNPTTENNLYALSLASNSDTEFVMTATADNGAAGTGGQELDEDCRTFSVDQLGRHMATNSGGTDSSDLCWR